MKPQKSFPLGLVLLTILTGRLTEAQTISGRCPSYPTSILFTPEVMVDIIERGEMFLTVAAGLEETEEVRCQTLSFHKQQTWSFSYRDSDDKKQVQSGLYKVEFPSFVGEGVIKMEGLSRNMLGSDSRGQLNLIPVAYSPGVAVFASCTEGFFWRNTQMVFVLMDATVDLTPINYLELTTELKQNNLIPELLESHLPDQTCASCPRPKGRCKQKNLPGYFSDYRARSIASEATPPPPLSPAA